MELEKIEHVFSICLLESAEQIDLTREFVFLQKTPDELSLVCESSYAPSDAIKVDAGWNALRVSGQLDFNQTGVIARIASILAGVGISIFVISTYNTDYVLIKAESYEKGINELACNDYVVK